MGDGDCGDRLESVARRVAGGVVMVEAAKLDAGERIVRSPEELHSRARKIGARVTCIDAVDGVPADPVQRGIPKVILHSERKLMQRAPYASVPLRLGVVSSILIACMLFTDNTLGPLEINGTRRWQNVEIRAPRASSETGNNWKQT